VQELEFKISNLSKGFMQSRNQSTKYYQVISLLMEPFIILYLSYSQNILRWLW